MFKQESTVPISKSIRLILIIALMALSTKLSATGWSVPSSRTPQQSPDSLSGDAAHAKIAEFLTNLEPYGFSGGVLVAKNSEVIASRGLGFADRERKIPCTEDTAFDIGSNTKDFTKIAILQLAERGKLKLSDTIGQYFPSAPPDKTAITIEQIMAHTAGFPEYTGDDTEMISRDEMLTRLFKRPLISTPGQEMNYSNPGYSLLAAIIEKLSGDSYEKFVYLNIFKPAGMEHTGYVRPEWKPGQIAHAYDNGHDQGSTLDYPHLPDGPTWNLRGNGGTLSTLPDMYRFHVALEGNLLLSDASKAKLFPQDRPLILVGGNGIHEFAYFRDPSQKLAILAASTDAGMKATDLAKPLRAIIAGRNISAPPKTIAIPAGEIATLAGKYVLPSAAYFVLSTSPGALLASPRGAEAFHLISAGTAPDPERAAAITSRMNEILKAAEKGDYAPWSAAFGGGVPVEAIKARQEPLKRARESKNGAYKGFEIVGITLNDEDLIVTVQLNFERDSAYTRYVWGPRRLAGVQPLEAAPNVKFLPVSPTDFASYDLPSTTSIRIHFEPTANSATQFTMTATAGVAVAKRQP
jgi:CubicO group peptidase (beta-lactamase class C family)